jgi:hypothetical protein
LPKRAVFVRLRWVLLLATGWIATAAAQTPTPASSFDVQISLSTPATTRLASVSGRIQVSAAFYSLPSPGQQYLADQSGRIELAGQTLNLSGKSQTIHLTIPDSPYIATVGDPIRLNVKVYSAPQNGHLNLLDNILNCEPFDGDLQDAVRTAPAIHCSLLTEKQANSTGLQSISPIRAADSYAIYSLLAPGSPSDTISPRQIHNWVVADATVNISDMNPAVPPDGQLKPPPDNEEGFNEALRDFQIRKNDRYHLGAGPGNPASRLSFVGRQQVNSLRNSRSVDTGITFFSAVYFNDTQTAALVYVNDWCANFCAAGQWVYLEKQSGQWVRRSGILSGGA